MSEAQKNHTSDNSSTQDDYQINVQNHNALVIYQAQELKQASAPIPIHNNQEISQVAYGSQPLGQQEIKIQYEFYRNNVLENNPPITLDEYLHYWNPDNNMISGCLYQLCYDLQAEKHSFIISQLVIQTDTQLIFPLEIKYDDYDNQIRNAMTKTPSFQDNQVKLNITLNQIEKFDRIRELLKIKGEFVVVFKIDLL